MPGEFVDGLVTDDAFMMSAGSSTLAFKNRTFQTETGRGCQSDEKVT